MAGGDKADEDTELGNRAIAYAELAVEGVRLPSWEAADEAVACLTKLGEATGVDDIASLAERASLSQTRDMLAVAKLIATAFVMGWTAHAEEPRRRARALGGVGESATRRARHGERRPRRRPVED